MIIGLAPSDVPNVHALGSHALRYVTFYQSKFGDPFLKDQTDLANVALLGWTIVSSQHVWRDE